MKLLANSILLLIFLTFCACSKDDDEDIIEKVVVEDGVTLSAIKLVQNFNDRELLFDQVFNVLESASEDYKFKLSVGQDGQVYDFTIANKEIVLDAITTDRVKLLYTSFLTRKNFLFKAVLVKISKISHEDGSGGSLIVYGITETTQEPVIFYYNTESNNEHWLDAPQ